MNENKDLLLPGYIRVSHSLKPVYDQNSRILILGSFSPVKSREQNSYYGHPQNRSWKLMGRLLKETFPPEYQGKKSILLRHRVTFWDMIHSCGIKGSSDQSICNVTPMDLECILQAADIREIITNGSTAHRLYVKYCRQHTGRGAVKCPSTSPVSAAFTLDRLEKNWDDVLLPLLEAGR